MRGFSRSGKILVKESRTLIDKPKSGRLYRVKRGARIINHRASAPGEAPAKLTGNLRSSIDYRVNGSSELNFGTNLKYGLWLERGTKRIKPRPYLQKAIENRRADIEKFIGSGIQHEIESRLR